MEQAGAGLRWLAGLIVLLAVGCAVPDYHMPHGFSSSYYRHLQRGQPTFVSPQQGYQPAPNAAGLPRTYQSLEMTPPPELAPPG